MKTRLALALLAVLLLGAAGLDFAGRDSHIARWLSETAPTATPPPEAPSTAAEPAPAESTQHAQWLAESKAIWEEALKRDPKTLALQAESFYREANPDKKFAILKSMGITITRAAFDQGMTDHRKSEPPRKELIEHIVRHWLREAPREALAWSCTLFGPALKNLDRLLANIMENLGRHPDFWAAFAEASPFPELAAKFKTWARESNDPGSIWAKHDMNTAVILDYMIGLIEDGSPEKALKVFSRCPHANLKRETLPRMVHGLSPTQLRQLANSEFASDPTLSNLLRAMAGDPEASYQDAADHFVVDPFDDGAMAKSREHFYAQWLARDPAAALAHVRSANDEDVTDSFMNAAVRSGQLNEQALFESLRQASGEQRDATLAAFYRAEAAGDPESALQRIAQSALIEDQVEAAKIILGDWARDFPLQAVDWLTRLPPGSNHTELVAAIASTWAYRDPKAAIAFAQQQGLGLRHGFMQAVADAATNRSESEFLDLLQPYKNDPQYGQLLVLGWMRNSSADPEAVFGKISSNATGNLQSDLVEVLTDRFVREDFVVDNFSGLTKALPTLDLTSVPAEKLAALAQRYVATLSNRGHLTDGLNWTLRLPPDAAALARSQIVADLLANQPDQRQPLRLWLQRTPLSPTERQRLLEQVQ